MPSSPVVTFVLFHVLSIAKVVSYLLSDVLSLDKVERRYKR